MSPCIKYNTLWRKSEFFSRLFGNMGGTLIFNMVKNRFAGVFYIGKTVTKNFLLKNFQIFLRHRGPISEGDEADFPKIGPKSDIFNFSKFSKILIFSGFCVFFINILGNFRKKNTFFVKIFNIFVLKIKFQRKISRNLRYSTSEIYRHTE